MLTWNCFRQRNRLTAYESAHMVRLFFAAFLQATRGFVVLRRLRMMSASCRINMDGDHVESVALGCSDSRHCITIPSGAHQVTQEKQVRLHSHVPISFSLFLPPSFVINVTADLRSC
jgi:hypothetical protein